MKSVPDHLDEYINKIPDEEYKHLQQRSAIQKLAESLIEKGVGEDSFKWDHDMETIDHWWNESWAALNPALKTYEKDRRILALIERLRAFQKDFVYLANDQETPLTPMEALNIKDQKIEELRDLVTKKDEAMTNTLKRMANAETDRGLVEALALTENLK